MEYSNHINAPIRTGGGGGAEEVLGRQTKLARRLREVAGLQAKETVERQAWSNIWGF